MLSRAEAAALSLGTESGRPGRPGTAAPGAGGFGPGDSGAAAGCLWESRCSPQVQSTRPGCSRTRLGASPAARPGVPLVPGARTSAPRSGALTMEHGLREAGVVMMTAAAAGADSQRPWSLPGPWSSRRSPGSMRAGRLCRWFLSPTPRLLPHPSQGGRPTPPPGSALCLSHNFRRIRRDVLSVSTSR